MDIPFSDFNPTIPSQPALPSPPIYAGSYIEPSDQFFVCTLCGQTHPVHPACPTCGKVHS